MKLVDAMSRRFRTRFACLFCLLVTLGCSASSIQAKEFRTNDFRFNVPATWLLNEKVPADVNVQFDIKTTNGVVPVRFKGYKPGNTNGTVSALISRWRRFVENPDDVEWQTHTHSIKDSAITYVEAWGALKYFSTATKKEIYIPNYSFFGAVIENPTGNVSIYMLGRSSVTDRLKPEFKNVLEEAVGKKSK